MAAVSTTGETHAENGPVVHEQRSHRQPTSLVASRNDIVKRLIDVILGSLFAVAVLPVIVVLAVALAISLRSWPLFIQRRIGKRSRPFSMVKLRTLPRSVPQYALKNELQGCPIPRVARFARRHHLDELPQLFLVPLGKLSLVGPRPKMPDFVEPVDGIYGAARVQVRQGCTGLWQISRDKTALPHEAPEYDFFYLRHTSVALDLWILWKTVTVTLHLSPPIDLRDVPEFLLRGPSAEIIDLTVERAKTVVLP